MSEAPLNSWAMAVFELGLKEQREFAGGEVQRTYQRSEGCSGIRAEFRGSGVWAWSQVTEAVAKLSEQRLCSVSPAHSLLSPVGCWLPPTVVLPWRKWLRSLDTCVDMEVKRGM